MVIIFVFIAIFHFLSHFVFLSMKMHIRKYLIFKEQGLFPIPNFEMLHIFIGCSSLHQPLALLSEVAVSTITVASGVSKSVSAITAIAVVGIRVGRSLAIAAISVAETAIAVAQTAVAVSGVSATIAVVSISLRVGRPLAIAAIAVAQTAIAVSSVSATVAVVSIGLRVGRSLAIAAISVAETSITVAQTAVAVSGVSGTIAIVSVGLRVSRSLAIAAISVAKTTIAIAKTAIAVSSVGSTIAIVSVSLRVSIPLDQAPVESPGGALLFRGVVWSHRVLSDDKSNASNGGSTVSPPSVPGLGLSLSRPLLLAEAVDDVLSVSTEERAIPVDSQRGSPASKTSQAIAGQTKT